MGGDGLLFLYLVQHAQAKTKEEDPERGLTEEGVRNTKKVANHLADLKIEVDLVFHSGKERARATAEILAAKLGFKGRVFEVEGLAPLDDPHIWSKKLGKMNESTMLVGHLPLLGRLTSLLLTGDVSKSLINFKNAGVVCLKREYSVWSIEWAITSDLIR